MKRKRYSKGLKSKVALAAIEGHQEINGGIHTNLLNRWKKEVIETLPLVFGNSEAKHAKAAECEHPLLSIQKQCELTGLSRSGYYRGRYKGGSQLRIWL